jgi:hypothetical protein
MECGRFRADAESWCNAAVRTLATLAPLTLFPVVFGAVACDSPPPRVPSGPASSASVPAGSAQAPAIAPELAARQAFHNPGGMWMPSQLADQADTLRSLGVELDPVKLADPTQFPLDAIVSLGGCSASFVSDTGLIVTNHHCVTAALQYNSTPDENLLRDGYLAKTAADEKSNGPTARVFVTLGFRDVTDEVLDALPTMKDDVARAEAMERRTKDLTASCEKGRPGVRCTIARYFDGASFLEVQQLEIRDVRLVYAPPASVGNFGGEIDNWRWPRHTGDFSFLRAYVDGRGQPADYSPNNVPYKPAHHLKIAKEPLKTSDFVMVAGYPGRTSRLKTAQEVEDAVAVSYPRFIARAEAQIALLEPLAEKVPALKIKAASQLRRLHNRLTNNKGTLEGLTKGGLAARRAAEEKALEAFIGKHPELGPKAGAVLGEMAEVRKKHLITRDADDAAHQIFDSAKLLSSALSIVKMAEERPKPDVDRDPAYQQRNWQRLTQNEESSQKAYDPVIDRALLSFALKEAAKLPEGGRPAALALITKKPSPTAAEIDAAVDALYKKTKLGDPKLRISLLEGATTKALTQHKDPLMKLAVALRASQRALELEAKTYEGAMAVLRPTYISALRAFQGGILAPDANSTLRITFGTVRGPEAGGSAFTLLPEVVKKTTGRDPFDTPTRLLEAAAQKDPRYVDADLGEVPVDFLADLDITGGNSGSATLNKKGELVGLAFDGTYDTVASDWMYMPKVTRSIQVDVRYILWVLDHVADAQRVLAELGVPKQP